MKKTLALCLLIVLCVFTYIRTDSIEQDPYLITDYSRLKPIKVERVIAGHEEEQLVRLINEARSNNKTVSIAGQRHSQGGHTYYKDGIVVDMTSYNKILEIDPIRKQIRVQAGATWEDVQKAVNPYHLAVKTMQSQNIFTIGGSISINAHGRDIRNESLIKSVLSFRLLNADGEVITVSRTENAELLPLALGGYGLFGIILDVTLQLTEDEVYVMETDPIEVEEYIDYFQTRVLADPAMRMHIARISVAPDSSFLTEMYAVNYRHDPSADLNQYNRLQTRESNVIPVKIAFGLNRTFDWAKSWFWRMQANINENQKGKRISRNNAMRTHSEFMNYSQPGKNDLLQEYFIPIDEFAGFIADMKKVLGEEKLNLLNITVRYVNRDEEAVLSYAHEDMFALVCLFHSPLSDEAQAELGRGISRLIDEVLEHRGTYYLPYAPYPTMEQFHKSYPRYQEFIEAKHKYDPTGVYRNEFFRKYGGMDEWT